MKEQIGIIGLGYVGLPVALALARAFPGAIGFDIDGGKIAALQHGLDRTGEVPEEALAQTSLKFTADPADLRDVTFFVMAVPTPVDRSRCPDLGHLLSASETVGRVLRRGAVVVYESTVYPGVTEEVCGPVLARVSGLCQGRDFKLGYSPERINPGDAEHTLERIVKVVAGEDAETLERVAAVYGRIVPAGLHRAPSIKVAETAKALENTQRDLNIALMNEMALICDRLGIRTRDVLAAAATKWNFLPFSPGLVGGHCIGVDPYYLTRKAQELGYDPEVILAGRRVNDSMARYLAQRLVKLLIQADISVPNARIGILGLTFKENVPDLRNSRVPDVIAELRQFGIHPRVHDPVADPDEACSECEIQLSSWEEMRGLDGVIMAVGHRQYCEMDRACLQECVRPGGIFMDVKSLRTPDCLPGVHYWSL